MTSVNQRHTCRLILGCLAGVFALTLGAIARAQSTWDGGGADNEWTTAANWSGDVAPTSATTTDITFAGSIRLSPHLTGAFSMRTLNFNSTAGAYTLSGDTISLQGVGAADSNAMLNLSSSLQTINNNISFTGPGKINAASGNMALNGNIDLGGLTSGGGVRFSANSGKVLTLSGVISGTLNSGGSIAYTSGSSNGQGTIYVKGNNTYVGSTSIWTGTVIIGSDALTSGGAFGASTSEVQLGAGNTASTFVPSLLTGGAYQVGRNLRVTTNTYGTTTVTIGGSTADVSTFSGNVYLGTDNAAAAGVNVTAAAGGRVNVTGKIARGSNTTGTGDTLIKLGSGIVALNASNNGYLGTTTVSAGTLLINGSLVSGGAQVSVSSGATLGGKGIINRAVAVEGGGIISAGDMDAVGTSLAGTLTVNGGLSLNATSVLQFDLGPIGSGSDLLSITGDFVLDGVLNITALSGFGTGTYKLISYSGGTFTDSGLTLGSMPGGYSYSLITTTPGEIDLQVIPEPTVLSLVALAGMLCWSQRRRQLI